MCFKRSPDPDSSTITGAGTGASTGAGTGTGTGVPVPVTSIVPAGLMVSHVQMIRVRVLCARDVCLCALAACAGICSCVCTTRLSCGTSFAAM